VSIISNFKKIIICNEGKLCTHLPAVGGRKRENAKGKIGKGNGKQNGKIYTVQKGGNIGKTGPGGANIGISQDKGKIYSSLWR
jgi:hypothetical protein